MAAQNTRERIVEAAAALLTDGGREAVSTRAVSAAAGVQAPTIYRIFGDKQGLLDAVAEHGFATYLTSKTSSPPSDDPVQDLRRGWDLHVGFGLAHPSFYTLIYGEPRPGVESPAAREAALVLAAQVRRIAEAGRLRVSEKRARESIIATVTGKPPAEPGSSLISTAVALQAALSDATALTLRERALLSEWLDRITDH